MKKLRYEDVQNGVFIFIALFVLGGVIFNKQIGELLSSVRPSTTINEMEPKLETVKSDVITVTPDSNPKPTESSSNNTNKTPTSYKPYVAGVCTKTTIPRGTDTKYVSYLYEDEENRYTGWDGYINSCTPDSNGYKIPDYTSKPYNDTLYKGTKKRAVSVPSTPASPRYTYEEAYDLAQNNCRVQLGNLGASNSSAFPLCVNAYLRQFGY